MGGHNRPNVLVVLTDQQRFDTISAHLTSFDTETPGMNALYRRGVFFENCYTTAPICGPARATLLTGLTPTQAGMPGNLGGPSSPLNYNITTVAHRMHQAGYTTVYHGKSHVGSELDHYGFDVAFENTEDFSTRLEASRYWRNRDWVWQKEPFFHVVSFINPHDIYFLDPDGVAEPRLPRWPNQDDTLEGKPACQKARHDPGRWTDERWEYYRRFYGECVAEVDEHVGLLIRELIRGGFGPNTWIVFAADHGDMSGEHGIPFKGPFMYEGVTHVPLMICPPWTRMAGAYKTDYPEGDFEPFTSPVLCSHVDIVPTVLDIAGVGADPNLPGRSLLPVVKGEPFEEHDAVYAEWATGTPIRMIRTHDWKYNVYKDVGEELYDMRNDPYELKSLAGDAAYAKVQTDLDRRLRSYLQQTGDSFFD